MAQVTEIIADLLVAPATDHLRYGNGELVYIAEGGDSTAFSTGYDLLTCWTMEENQLDPGKPSRLLCGSSSVTRCTQTSCAGAPPLPLGVAAQISKMAIRHALEFQDKHIVLPSNLPPPGPPSLLGPVYSAAYTDTIPTLDDTALDVFAWMGPQLVPKVMHVYRLEDPNAGTQTPHPLHKHIIAIPVALQYVPPPVGPL